MMTTAELLTELDLKICWECAETKPVFAHNTCLKLHAIITELAELIGEETSV
jgi:hypothetical protein